MREEVSFSGLVIVMAVAFLAPFVLGLFPKVALPAVVLEIVLGIVIGPSVLGWVEDDLLIQILSVMGLGFLLFVSGLEVELDRLRGRVLRLPAIGFVVSLGLSVLIGLILRGTGQVDSPLLIAIALISTSLGLVVPVLKDAGQAETDFGQLVIAGATLADFGAVILLTLFFSEESSGIGSTLLLLGIFFALVVVVGFSVAEVGRLPRIAGELMRLADTTAQIRIRGSVLLLVGFLFLASRFGLEVILGAFLAGVILGRVDRRATMDHPQFRHKLEGIAYGFVVPVFFVSSGIEFDLRSLFADAGTLLLVPMFLVGLLIVRGTPALLYRPVVGNRMTAAAGLLQATSLPLIVTTAMIGRSLGVIDEATSAALIAAGLLSVLIFPILAITALQKEAAAGREVGVGGHGSGEGPGGTGR